LRFSYRVEIKLEVLIRWLSSACVRANNIDTAKFRDCSVEYFNKIIPVAYIAIGNESTRIVFKRYFSLWALATTDECDIAAEIVEAFCGFETYARRGTSNKQGFAGETLQGLYRLELLGQSP
jgi:hypothetical protein